MMIECAFTFPAGPAHGYPHKLEAEIISRYGGYTQFNASGGWKGPKGRHVTEAVYYYVVAVESPTEVHTLHDLVASTLKRAGEHSMFWRVDHTLEISIYVL